MKTIKVNGVKKIGSLGGLVLCLLLVLVALPAWGKEVRFSGTQGQLGQAFLNAAQLRFDRGEVQEELGRLIQDAGVLGKIDQEAFGRKIATSASLKWQAGRVQEQIGSAIVAAASASSEETLFG